MNKIKSRILWVLITILLCLCFVFFGMSKVNAASSESAAYDIYTDSDQIIGYNGYTIQNYSDKLFTTKIKPTFDANKNLVLQNKETDDPIIGIIPKQLFKEVNKTLHIGKEYGFYIDTAALGNNFVSIVLVFDISTNTNLMETIDRVIISVSPVFQYKFAYLKASESTLSCQNGYILNYSLTDDRVVPYPSNITSSAIQFDMVEKYYLKDISYGLTLNNENNLNRYDVGYDPYKDNGSYFTAMDYTYNGKSREYGEFPTEELINIGLDVAEVLLGPAGETLGVIRNIADVFEFGGKLIDMEYGHQVQVGTGELTTTCYYQNRDDQLRNYIDKNGTPTLMKSAALIINTPQDKSVWYGIGDDVTGYFTISHSALNDVSAEYTRLTKEIAVKVVESDGDTQVAASTSLYDHFLRQQKVKLVAEGKVDLYTIKDAYDKFMFSPNESEYYTFKNCGIYSIELKINDGLTITSYTNIKKQQSVRIKLDKTKIYFIEAGGIHSEAQFHSFLMSIDLDPDEIQAEHIVTLSFGNAAEKWYKFNSNKNDVSVFLITTSERMFVYNEKFEIIDSIDGTRLEVLTKVDQKYFIKIIKIGTTDTISFQHSYKPISTISQTVGANRIFFKTYIDIVGNYGLNFISDSSSSLHIQIYDADLSLIEELTGNSLDNIFEHTGLYFIGIKLIGSGPVSVTFSKRLLMDSVFLGANNIQIYHSLEYNLYAFQPTATAKYTFTADTNSIYVVDEPSSLNDLQNTKLNAGTIYYVKIYLRSGYRNLEIKLKDYQTIGLNTPTSGKFNADEYVFYQLSTVMQGKYKIEAVNAQILLFTWGLSPIHINNGNEFTALSEGVYYLKLIGGNGNNYTIKYYFDPVELQVNHARVMMQDTFYQVKNNGQNKFIIKTFGVDSISTKIRYTTDLVNYTDSTNVSGHATLFVNCSKNVFYVFVDITGSGFVGVSVEYEDPIEYTQGGYQLRESEIYGINFLRKETKNFAFNIPTAALNCAFEIRLKKNLFTNFQMAVDGKLIKCDDLEEGSVARFIIETLPGNHVISLRYDCNEDIVNEDFVSLVAIRKVEELNLAFNEVKTGIAVRDGIRAGYDYSMSIVVNGELVKDHFIIDCISNESNIKGNIVITEDILHAYKNLPFHREVTFRVNYAFVNYYLTVSTEYPYHLSVGLIQNDNQLEYNIPIYDYYTRELLHNDTDGNTLARFDIKNIEVSGKNDDWKVLDKTIYNSDPHYKGDISFDLLKLNYFKDVPIKCIITLTDDSTVIMSQLVIRYQTNTSIENFDPNNKKVLYIDVSGLDYSDNYRMSSVTVPESVKVVCVKGNGNSYNFHGFEFLGDTTFNLYNVSITGQWSGAPAATEKDLTINVLGEVSLNGCVGYFGTMQAMGTPAVKAKNLTLEVQFGAGLNLKGGEPFNFDYNGNRGTRGSNGTNGANGTSGSKNGENGKQGGTGATGVTGDIGICGVKCDYLYIVADGKLKIVGSQGCRGGYGGDGGTGGNGGDGYAVGGWGQTSGNGGNGGRGGMGGRGGTGGTGGAGVECKSITGMNSNCTITGGTGGNGGYGGNGGAGGTGGSGAKAPWFGHAGNDGSNGATGSKGSDGYKGSTGIAIKYV